MRIRAVISAALISLSACANQQPTENACVVAHSSGFVGAERGQEQLTVAQNGAPCVFAATIRRETMGQGEVVTAPAHGTAAVRATTEATLISYTPARGYVGADRFDVGIGPNIVVTVLVQVVPAVAGSVKP